MLKDLCMKLEYANSLILSTSYNRRDHECVQTRHKSVALLHHKSVKVKIWRSLGRLHNIMIIFKNHMIRMYK